MGGARKRGKKLKNALEKGAKRRRLISMLGDRIPKNWGGGKGKGPNAGWKTKEIMDEKRKWERKTGKKLQRRSLGEKKLPEITLTYSFPSPVEKGKKIDKKGGGGEEMETWKKVLPRDFFDTFIWRRR